MSAAVTRQSATGVPSTAVESTALLHNIGGPPLASIRWNGLGRAIPSAQPGAMFEQADRRSTWLYCVFRLKQRLNAPERFRPDRYRFLLECVLPEHGLNEVSSKRRLSDLLEAHTRALSWPPHLITRPQFSHDDAYRQLTIDHPLTVFVALARSIGNLWSSERPLMLSRLTTPAIVEYCNTMHFRQVTWQTSLWFPNGIPANLLAALRQAHDNRLEGL